MLKNEFKKKTLKINIIPLIDIIFLMLVFFMLATNFSKNKQVSFLLDNKKQATNSVNEKNVMLLNLRQNKIFFEDKIVNLELLEKKYFNVWKSLNYEKIIILNDRETEVQLLITILDLIKKNNIKNVKFFNEIKDTE